MYGDERSRQQQGATAQPLDRDSRHALQQCRSLRDRQLLEARVDQRDRQHPAAADEMLPANPLAGGVVGARAAARMQPCNLGLEVRGADRQISGLMHYGIRAWHRRYRRMTRLGFFRQFSMVRLRPDTGQRVAPRSLFGTPPLPTVAVIRSYSSYKEQMPVHRWLGSVGSGWRRCWNALAAR